MSYTLFVFNSAPYANSRTQDGLDALFAFAAFEQPVKVLFCSDGVLCWQEAQTGGTRKNVRKWLDSFDMYDITDVFIQSSAAQERDLPPTPGLPVTAATKETVQSLITNAAQVLSF